MPPYDVYAILSCETSLVDFLAENPLLVGGDQEEDHRARKLGLTTIALHSLTVLIDFDKPPRPEIFVRNLSTRHFRQIERLKL